VAGLRESFFQRQGALTAEAEAWRLKVQPRAFDMLIDQIPWGFTTQRMPWMAQVLYVDWR
ncbi:MAG TPA: contractile injection system tape measure protein, partial [Phenylobacterium sp.]